MTISELKTMLTVLENQGHGNKEFMILDGFNGGGSPRELNLGPHSHKITQEEADDSADCEDLVGETVFVAGFGCY